MKLQARRGSHLPVLTKLVQTTSGPILEMGCGLFSTVYLFWACMADQRRLVTYENEPEFYEWATDFKNPKNHCNMDFHEIHLVKSYDDAKLDQPWSIAFIDHCPDDRRVVDIARLTHADYVVVHDAEPGEERKRKIPLSSIYDLFRYRFLYTDAKPNTLILSNKFDIRHFMAKSDRQVPSIDRIVPETEMVKTHPGRNRRYTICRALREIFVRTEDPETKLRLRYACTLAEYITAKVDRHNPGWLKDFYPLRRNWKDIMK